MSTIEERIAALEARVAALEGRESYASPPRPVEGAPEAHTTPEDTGAPLFFLGRSVLILGGAFVLRALTESALIPQLAGVVLGLLYAAFWARRTDRELKTLFDSTTASVIAFPLIWETTTRFQLLPPAVASLLIVVFGWFVVRNTNMTVRWIGSGAAAITFIAVAIGAHTALPFMIGATVFAIMTLAWPAILASDILALALLGAMIIERSPHSPREIVAGLMLFGGAWIVAIAARCLVHQSDATLMEIAQLVEASLVGTCGALVAARIGGVQFIGVGIFAVFVAIGMGALMFAARALPQLLTTASFAGAAALLLGSLLLAGARPASLLWAGIAIAAAEWARRNPTTLVAVHAVLWMAAASIAGGVLVALLGAFIDPTLEVQWTAVAIAALALLAFVRMPAEVNAARVALLAIGVSGAYGTAVGIVGTATPMQLAVARTAILAILAALLAAAARFTRGTAPAVLARTVLIVGGLKLLAEDLRVGNALMLVVALGVYGCALVIVSRVKRPVPSLGT